MNKTRAAAVASFVLAAATIASTALLANRAEATTTTNPKPLCADWKAQGATGKYPNITWGAPGPGTKLEGANAKLVKPTSGDDPGVELAAKNLDLEWVVPVDISVHFDLDDAATHAAGAVRLFYYKEGNPNTVTQAPDGQDVAMSDLGVLKIDNVLKVGTIGLVYDASNSSAGSAKFANLTIKGVGVDLVLPFTDTCPTPSASATATPTPSASVTATPSATATTTGTAAPATSVSTSPAASLPVTGDNPIRPLLIGVGVLLIGLALVGAAYLWRSRRESNRFEA